MVALPHWVIPTPGARSLEPGEFIGRRILTWFWPDFLCKLGFFLRILRLDQECVQECSDLLDTAISLILQIAEAREALAFVLACICEDVLEG